jgi:hypothetical protein
MASMTDEDPKGWGRSFWIVMRKIVDQYPDSNPSQEVRQSALAFFQSLMDLLPCGKCRSHYTELFHKYPIQKSLGSKFEMTAWYDAIKAEVDAIVYPSAAPVQRTLQYAPIRRRLPPGRQGISQRPLQKQQPATLKLQPRMTPVAITPAPIMSQQRRSFHYNHIKIAKARSGCSACKNKNVGK